MDENFDWKFRLAAFGFVLFLLGMVYLNVREYPVYSNTIGVRGLVIGSVLVAAALAAGLIFALRDRLLPARKHWPELVFIVFPMLFFAPLFGSWLNRAGGKVENLPFEFMSEQAFVASGYGLLKGEKIKPSGYRLTVREGDKLLTFKYKQQAYFPITKMGETVLLPVRTGIFGKRVVELK